MGHTTATIFLQRGYCQTYSGYPRVGFCLSTGHCTGARDTVAFLERKVPDFISPALWPPGSPVLNPVDYSIWSVLQEKVYRSTIANISELYMRLINERGRFFFNFRVSNIRVSNRTLIYNVCPEAALT